MTAAQRAATPPPKGGLEKVEAVPQAGEAKPEAPAKPVIPGLRRAAIAILLLGDDLTKRLFRHFRPDEVRRILAAANDLRGVTEEEVLIVLEDLVAELEQGVPGVSGHGHRIEEAAVSVFGADLLRQVNNKEVAGIAMQIHAVAADKPDLFAKTIQKEHPQTIAVIMAMLPPEVGGAVLRHLPQDVKADIVRRVARLRTVSSTVVAEVTEKVGREFVRPSDQGPINIDGMDMAVKLLKKAGPNEEQPILEDMERTDAETTQQLKNKLFTFEDLRFLHDREVQLVMREIDQRLLPLALKTASPELQQKLLGNVSKRAAEMLKDDLQAMGPVTLSQVEEAQNRILQQVLTLATQGRVNIRPGTTV
ncbi:MAG: flagellar motor switch protein FliG [Deltaproteobacteria bacterium]|nr:flagellar motor switch protein FliG [Deltaproteobacteria bacterium]